MFTALRRAEQQADIDYGKPQKHSNGHCSLHQSKLIPYALPGPASKWDKSKIGSHLHNRSCKFSSQCLLARQAKKVSFQFSRHTFAL